MKEGQALVLPKKDRSFDPTRLPKAVKDAGFTPGEIELTAAGKLTAKNGVLRLEMEGPIPALALAGGSQAKELRSQRDLLGRRVTVTGRFAPGGKNQPPSLSIEEWKPVQPD